MSRPNYTNIASGIVCALGLASATVVRSGPFDTNFNPPKLRGQPFLGPRVTLQFDGRILVHGQLFNTVGGVETGPVARFDSNGTRDSTFAFSRDYVSAFSVAPLSNGQMMVDAQLNSYNGFTRELVLRVQADGSVDKSFDAGSGADGNIRRITVQPDGKILVGGLFTNFNSSAYQYVVRLNTDGAIDSSFGPVSFTANTNSLLASGIWAPILVQPDGKILLGGFFSTVNGVARDGLVRLNSDGTVDRSFIPSGFSVLNGRPIRGLGFQSDGRLILGGRLALGAGTTRRPLIRLDTNGVADTGFVTSFTSPGSWIRDLAIAPQDKIVAVDEKAYRFNADGTLDSGFNHGLLTDPYGNNFAGMAFSAGVQNDGKILIAGGFSLVGGQRRDGIARFNPDGSLDSFDVGRLKLDSFAEKLAVQRDGRLLVSSDFNEANGTERLGLARFGRDGALDQGFNPGDVFGAPVSGFVLHPDEKIFIYGVDPLSESLKFQRLKSDGTPDASYLPTATISGIGNAVGQPDGKILLLADRDAQLIEENNLVRRLNYDGSWDGGFQLDASFNQVVRDPDTGRTVTLYGPGPRPLLMLPSGKLVTASITTNLSFKLLQLEPDGRIDVSFAAGMIPGAMGFSEDLPLIQDPLVGNVYQVRRLSAENLGFFDATLQSDGKIIVVGQFTNYNGAPARGIVRLNPDGLVDATFNPGLGPQWVTTAQIGTNYFARIEAVKLAPGNKILIVGNFEAFNGFPLKSVARLNSDGSVDTNFCCSLERRDFGLYPRSPSQLLEEPDGNFLVTGQFTRTVETDPITLWRLLVRPILSISALPGRSFQLNLSGGADSAYTVQTSSDFLAWQSLTNLITTNDTTTLVDSPAPPSGHKFYRMVNP